MTDERETPESDGGAGTSATEALAERYLDFWQRNLTTWSSDPDLLGKWARQILNHPGHELHKGPKPDDAD